MTDTPITPPEGDTPPEPHTEKRHGRPPVEFDRDAAMQRVAAGTSTAKVALEFKVHRSVIDREVRARGGLATLRAPIPRTGLAPRNEELRRKVAELVDQGLKQSAIAKALKVSKQRVSQILNETT